MIIFWAGMLVLWVMTVNMSGAYVKMYERKHATVGELFTGLGIRFFRKLGGFLWMVLWLIIWSLPSLAVATALAYASGAIVARFGPWGFHIAFELSGWRAFLAMLCFAPVVIKGLSYFMVPYILGYHTEVKAIQALRLSRRMTKGYKGSIFAMHLSFIGWVLLGLLPIIIFGFFGILSENSGSGLVAVLFGVLGSVALYVVLIVPYMYTSIAGLFVELRDKGIAEGVVSREELGMSSVAFVQPGADAPMDVPLEVELVIAPPMEEELADKDDLTDEGS